MFSLGQSALDRYGSALDPVNWLELPRCKETSLACVHMWRDVTHLNTEFRQYLMHLLHLVIASAVLVWVRRVFTAPALGLLEVSHCTF